MIIYHFKRNYFLVRAQSLIIGKFVSHYTSYSLIFNPLHSVINLEQYKKHHYNHSSHYGKYEMLDCWSTCPNHQFISDCVARFWCITMLRFQLPQTHWVTSQTKNSVRGALASTALTQVSRWNHNVHNPNCHLHSKGERDAAQRRTKVSFGRTNMQALELLQLVGEKARLWMKQPWLVNKLSL